MKRGLPIGQGWWVEEIFFSEKFVELFDILKIILLLKFLDKPLFLLPNYNNKTFESGKSNGIVYSYAEEKYLTTLISFTNVV